MAPVPTAQILVECGTSIASSSVVLFVPMFGLATVLQAVPFQCSIKGCACGLSNELLKEPTAQTSCAESATTPPSTLSSFPGFWPLTLLQTLPSQCWISVFVTELSVMVLPTIQTSFVETAAIADGKFPGFPTFGFGITDHDVPFQCSIKAFVPWKPRCLLEKLPTAQAFVAEVAATALR